MHEPKVERKPEPEKDSQGIPKITLKYLKANCEYNRGYNTPELNDVLYLNHRGFRVMENLDEYYNCKVLHMDGNGFRGIQNISHMHNLRSLFLHDNLLTRIEGLTQFAMLDTLNLANNMIEKIEGLENCTKLTKLDMTANKLTDYDSVRQLRYNPNLNILILKENKLQFDERIIEMLSQQMQVKYLVVSATPLGRTLPRRGWVYKLPSLTFLDDHGVSEEERRLAVAREERGEEGEREEARMIKLEKTLREKRYVQEVRERTRLALLEYDERQRCLEMEAEEAEGDGGQTSDGEIEQHWKAVGDEDQVPDLENCDSKLDSREQSGVKEVMEMIPPTEALICEFTEDFLHMEYKPTCSQVIEAIAEIERRPKTKKLEWSVDLETSLEGLLLACRFDMEKAAMLFNEFLDLVDPDCEPVLWQDLARKWKEMKYSPKKLKPKLDPKWQQLIEVISTRSQQSRAQPSSGYSKPSESDRPATIIKSDIPDDLKSLQSDYEG